MTSGTRLPAAASSSVRVGREPIVFATGISDALGLAIDRITHQALAQMSLHIGPLARDNAVENSVADTPVAARMMMADHAVFLRAQRLDRALRCKIEIVGAES